MTVTVRLTYDMSKALGTKTLEIDQAATVRDAIEATRERFERSGDPDFEKLSRVAAVAVNGVLMRYRKGLRTPLSDGDTVAFVKASAGG